MTASDRNATWRLRPVVELEPGTFGRCETPSPGLWSDDQAQMYWRTCLAQSGITELDPVAPRSWHVLAEQIRVPATLTTILKAHFGDGGIPADREEVSALSGGFALVHHADVIVLPSCCGDLGNLGDWAQAAEYEGSEPTMLWIGHPWLSVWCEGEILFMREENEDSRLEPGRPFQIARRDLRQAVELAGPEVDALFERIVIALEAFGPMPDRQDIARRLVGR